MAAWGRALARLRAVEAEIRGIGRATAGGTVEEEEALQAVYDACLEDHSAALMRLIRAVVTAGDTYLFAEKYVSPVSAGLRHGRGRGGAAGGL